MNDKERAWFNELVTTKMNEIVKELELKSQPEPQAGDVWDIGDGCYLFIFQNKFTGQVGEVHKDGSGYRVIGEDIYTYAKTATRIFSLQEYLKNKEAE